MLEDVLITNNQVLTMPFEMFSDVKTQLKIDRTIYWDESINEQTNKPFVRKEISLIEDVTIEQALSCEPSPDLTPITVGEQEKCEMAIKEFLRQWYPNDVGKWLLKTLHREKGCIFAVLIANKQENFVFLRKLTIIIDTKSFQIINFIDNIEMLEVFDQFQVSALPKITPEEAYEKMRGLIELKPCYAYAHEQKQYVLCGGLACKYGVNAENGEIISIDDL